MTFTKHPTAQLPFPADSPWSRCINAWILESYQHSHSEKTRLSYSSVIRCFFSELQKTPDMVTRENVLTFLHSRNRSNRNHGAEPSVGTIRHRKAILASFYQYAARFTVLNEVSGRLEPLLKTISPVFGMRTVKPSLEYRALSAEELERLFAVIPQTPMGLRDRAIYLLFTLSARRRAELATLRWKDIQPAVLIDADGTRRQGRVYHFRNKGSSQVDDMAELPELAYQAICTYLSACGRLDTIQPNDPIFVPFHMGSGIRYDQSKALSDTSMNRRLKRYAQDAHIDRAISLHVLRHTSAALRRANGDTLESIMELLRHQDLSTTWRYCRQLSSPSDRGSHALEAMFSHFS
jgi:integrase/recombinase XerD